MTVSKEDDNPKEVLDMLKVKKGAKFVAVALTFGVFASVAFQGTNFLFNQISGGEETQTTAQLNIADSVSSTSSSSSDSSASSGTSADVSSIAEETMPSLVAITNQSVQEMMNWFGQSQAYESVSSGTGIIVGQTDTELLIVTNNHVIDGAQTLSVGFTDESVAQASIKGTDADHDIAVIAVNLSDISEDTLSQIKIIEIGSSSDLQVGEQVVAIGNALGYGQSVTTGIVSALNRSVTIDGVTNELIQTDAAINPGNSGGALLNMSGQLVGINSAKYSDTNVEGMGYAIPVDDVIDIIENLMNRTVRTEIVDESERGFLGITGQDVTSEVSEAYDMPRGVYITSVEEGSAAEAAGLQKGDIITKFDGTSVSSLSDLQELLTYYRTGETIEVTYSAVSEGQYVEQTATVTLGTNTNITAASGR